MRGWEGETPAEPPSEGVITGALTQVDCAGPEVKGEQAVAEEVEAQESIYPGARRQYMGKHLKSLLLTAQGSDAFHLNDWCEHHGT